MDADGVHEHPWNTNLGIDAVSTNLGNVLQCARPEPKRRLFQTEPAQFLLPVAQEILPARLEYGALAGQGSPVITTDQEAACSQGRGGSRRRTESSACKKGTAGVGAHRNFIYLMT
jgi:hypothetical protein